MNDVSSNGRHTITKIDDIEPENRPSLTGQIKSRIVTRGKRQVTLVKFEKGAKTGPHAHSSARTAKFLLQGKLVFSDKDGTYTQDFLPGEQAVIRRNVAYVAEAIEDSWQLLIEEKEAKTLTEGRSMRKRVRPKWRQQLFIVRKWLSPRVLLLLSIFVLLFLSVLGVLAAGVFLYDTPAAILMNAFSVFFAGIFSTIIAYVTSRILDSNANRVAAREGRFQLRGFLNEVDTARQEVVIYSTFSRVFDPEEQNGEILRMLENTLRSKAKEVDRDFKLKVLLLDPFSAAAQQRQEERRDISVEQKILTNLDRLCRLLHEEDIRRFVDVRIAASLPRFQMYAADGSISWSFYPRQHAPADDEHLRCNTNSLIGGYIYDSFVQVWEDIGMSGQKAGTRTLEEFVRLNRDRVDATQHHFLKAYASSSTSQ